MTDYLRLELHLRAKPCISVTTGTAGVHLLMIVSQVPDQFSQLPCEAGLVPSLMGDITRDIPCGILGVSLVKFVPDNP